MDLTDDQHRVLVEAHGVLRALANGPRDQHTDRGVRLAGSVATAERSIGEILRTLSLETKRTEATQSLERLAERIRTGELPPDGFAPALRALAKSWEPF